MGTHSGKKATGRTGVPPRANGSRGDLAPRLDHNEVRRKQYAADPGYADRQRELSRQTYRKERPLSPSRLQNGLLFAGTLREVFAEGMEHPHTVECYTIPEVAKALGKTELTIKKWLEDDLLPEPILRDTTYSYRQYSIGEVQIIARVLAEHERDFSYYAVTHTRTKEHIMQGVHGYRQHGV